MCVKSLVSAVEKLSAQKSNPVPSFPSLPRVSITPTPVQTPTPVPVEAPSGPTFAQIASRQVPSQSVKGGLPPGHQVRSTRNRSKSPQVKRDHTGEELAADSDGFRRQGRPRHLHRPAAAGASQVVVEEVGDLQPSLQYFMATHQEKQMRGLSKRYWRDVLRPYCRIMNPWS